MQFILQLIQLESKIPSIMKILLKRKDTHLGGCEFTPLHRNGTTHDL